MNLAADSVCEGVPLADLARVAQMLRVLAHPHRLKVLEVLRARRGAPVHDVAALVGLPPAATSQLLNQMRRVGLLAGERHGREVWYTIADRRAVRILDCVCKGGRQP